MEKFDKTTRKQYRTMVEEEFPESFQWGKLEFQKKLSMRYGENPGYPAAFYMEPGASGPNMASIDVVQQGTKGLSYINIGDMDLGLRLVKKLTGIYPDKRICVLVKHEMPSGVAMGEESADVFEKAWGCDPLSNFGSVDIFNHTVDKPLAETIVEKGRNVEVVFAPEFTQDALDVLAMRKPLRVVKLCAPVDVPSSDNGLEFKRVEGGLLVQKRFDSKIVSPDSVEVVSKRMPSKTEVEAAIFCWTVACFTRSNAIVIGSPDKIHGIGSGQRSRIDAAEDAIKFSMRGYGPEGCVMASDAFMPFSDVVELAARSGITAIIYPLGSIRDEEVLEKANELGLAMIITKKPGESDSERCFLHR
jgi:phosphoribosylaminoimidazolecarboxamide formyltransferase/IMP cyclohydrolase